MDLIRIAIITPVYGAYEQAYISSLILCLSKPLADISFSLVSPCGSSNITAARNVCIQDVFIQEEAFKKKFDYLLFIDSDIIFTYEDIQKLLGHKKDIIAGLYFAKGTPFFPVAGYYDINKIENGFPKITKEQVTSKKLLEVDWAGCGFLLLKREIIDRIEYPWFDMRVIDLPKPLKRSGGFVIKKELLSEDISFCTRLKEIGYKIYLDTNVLLKHLGKANYTIEHFLAL